MNRSDMPPHVSIRRALRTEAGTIAELVKRAFESQCVLYDDWSLPPMRETGPVVAEAMETGTVLVAELDGRIVGSVRGSANDGVVEVGRLVVDPDMQRHGIGRMLVDEIERAFPSASRFEIFTGHLSTGPLSLYQEAGYSRTRESRVNDRVTLVYLEKRR